MARVKKHETTLKSLEDVDAALADYRQLEDRQAAVEAWLSERVAKLKQQAEAKLIIDERTGDTVADRMAAIAANIEAYIEENDSLFVAKRTIELNNGNIGRRWSTPRVTTIKGVTQKALLAADAILSALRRYGWLVEKPQLNKTAILDEWNGAESRSKVEAKLAKVSLRIQQTDTPWFEIARETAETQRAAAEQRAA